MKKLKISLLVVFVIAGLVAIHNLKPTQFTWPKTQVKPIEVVTWPSVFLAFSR